MGQPSDAKGNSPALPGSTGRERELEALGRQAGGILHDLNNLLTVIIGYSELAMACEGDPGTIRSSLYEINQSALYASALSRQYHLRPPELNHPQESCDLDQVLRNMRGTLEGILGTKVQLNLDLCSGGSPVHGSAVQMVQIILNLTINARDAMPDGGFLHIATSAVDFSLSRNRPEGGEVFAVLSVRDTGMGMSLDVRKRIFDPFFTTKSHSGTGLGLTTVRDVARSAGGFIRVESEPGRGTCFRVYLPRAVRKDALPDPIAQSSISALPQTTPNPAPRRSMTVVIAEDHLQARELMVDVLRADGYQVLECDRGDRALELCCSTPQQIDLLLTDVHLPGMTGAELARRVQELRPETCVLLISGDVSQLAPLPARDAAPLAMLTKPFTIQNLRQAVGSLIWHPAPTPPPDSASGFRMVE